ncbi:MAG: threonine/serine dehydratase [Gammaproteobacteria bacterium]
MITPDLIEQAAWRIQASVRQTPVITLEPGAFDVPGQLTLKLELLQHTGSFKARGAFNRLLSADVPAAGVVAASGGNHGAAVAYAAQQLGHPAAIFVPQIASAVKIQRLRDYGAQVTVTGAAYADAFAASLDYASNSGAMMVHAYDQAEVLIGQGTTGRELEQQAPELDTVLVAVGGGGFIGGIAAWYRGRIKLIGVEPDNAPTLSRALQAGQPVDVEVSGIAADSLGARRIGTLMFPLAQQYLTTVTVSDEAIQSAQQALWQKLRLVTEPGGATALAALLSGRYVPAPGERVGVLVCGGNTDPATLSASQ